ncbi:MAG TPA: hypothetical protein VIR57_10975 [Chloroflexota bacterium]
MGERPYQAYENNGQIFRFHADEDGTLHVLASGEATRADVYNCFWNGERTFDPKFRRFVSRSATHVLYWAWYDNVEGNDVVVISCRRPS